jgi:hypothetical protein
MFGRRAAALVAGAVLGFGLVACGDDSDGGDGEGDSPETAIIEILGTAEPEVCDRVTENFIEQITGQTGEEGRAACEESVTSGEPPADLEVAEISEEGETATGTVTSAEGSVDFEMVQEDGEWKLDALALAEGPDSSGGGGSGGGGSGGGGSGGGNE